MGNIIGEGFPSKIIEQIKQRQNIYGSVNRSERQLAFLNTRTGWCKLVSSVDVDDTSIRGLGLGKSQLAEKFVLFNGTTNESPTKGAAETYQRAGIYNDLNPPGTFSAATSNNNFAYGMGGTEFGLNPMPGIISATIKTETKGSIKTATVVIKANNRQQFDIIDILYMRLGYSVLLEWGNSSYYDNNGVYQPDNTYSLADKFLTGASDVQYDKILETINKKRLDSCGNYDAMFAKVVNFSWNFTKEGTYNITLKLISAGDVIESLKANLLLPGDEYIPNGTTNNAALLLSQTASLGANTFSGGLGTGGFGSNPFGQINTSTFTSFNNSFGLSSTAAPSTNSTIKSSAYSHEIGKMFNYYMNELANIEEIAGMSVIKESDTEYSGITSGESVSFFKQTYTDNGGTQYYVKLAWFLKFLEKTIIPYVNDNLKARILKIDNKVEDNIIYLLGRQLSTDPRICIFNVKFSSPNGFTQFAGQADIFDATSINTNRYGLIMNSYFNMTFILSQLESLKDKDGRVSIFRLIKSLCDGWNRATGNFNKLEPNIDSDTNTIRIIDQVQLPNRDDIIKEINKRRTPETQIPTELAFFDVYGYFKGGPQAGFIKDLSFTTTVPPNLATLITVGATSNGYVVGQDSTALSRMNAGLTDRFKKTLNLELTSTVQASTSSLNLDYSNALEAFNVFVGDLGSWQGTEIPTWNVESITSFNTTAAQFYEYDQAKQTIEAAGTSSESASAIALGASPKSAGKSSPNCGFLPFDLSLTMDGLSGMKVYQKYIIDTDFLPTNYPTSLEFIIKTITNTIQNNQWTTTLESIAIPKNPFGSSISVAESRKTSKIYDSLTILPEKYITSKDNNPFNLRPLRKKKNTDQFNGSIGKKEGFSKNGLSIGYFTIFDTLDNGIRAGMKNLSTYFTKYDRNTVNKIISVYAPGGTPGQSTKRTSDYVDLITEYMQTNYNSAITSTTVLTFNGASETNADNIKMFKTLVTGILKQEGGFTSEIGEKIDNFVISSLAS